VLQYCRDVSKNYSIHHCAAIRLMMINSTIPRSPRIPCKIPRCDGTDHATLELLHERLTFSTSPPLSTRAQNLIYPTRNTTHLRLTSHPHTTTSNTPIASGPHANSRCHHYHYTGSRRAPIVLPRGTARSKLHVAADALNARLPSTLAIGTDEGGPKS
jgi:hypothetical protein